MVAKLEGNPEFGIPGSGPDPIQLAMRALLVARFRLKTHREAREMDIYALVMLKPGIPGPALNRRRRTARRWPMPRAVALRLGLGRRRQPDQCRAASSAARA